MRRERHRGELQEDRPQSDGNRCAPWAVANDSSGQRNGCTLWRAFTNVWRTKTSTAHRVRLIKPMRQSDPTKLA